MEKTSEQLEQERQERKRERERRREELRGQIRQAKAAKETYEGYKKKVNSAKNHIEKAGNGLIFMQGTQKESVAGKTQVAINPRSSTLNLLGLVYDRELPASYTSLMVQAAGQAETLLSQINQKIDGYETTIRQLQSQLNSI